MIKLSSIWLRLHCLFGCHLWTSYLQGDRPQDIHLGYTWRVCYGCGAQAYAPGYFPPPVPEVR